METRKFPKKNNISFTTHSSFLERIRNGSENAWNEFYRKYAGMIYNIGQKRHLSPEECDDLMIDVMVIFWKKIDDFIYDRERGKFRSYLNKIASFAALKIFSRRDKQHNELRSSVDYPADINSEYMDEWHNFILEKAMDDLEQSVDTETYQIFCMSFLQHRPIAEISAITRKTANNIYVIRSRCLKKLKKLVSMYRQYEEEELAGHSTRKDCPSTVS